jgi:hypothetical protein
MLAPRLIPLILTLVLATAALAGGPEFDSQASKDVKVQNVTLNGDTVSGVVSNVGRHPVRDVQMQITYVWLWNNERHPGTDNPGRTDYYTAPGEIPTGGSQPFTYRPTTPLAHRTDGHFAPSVNVTGFTEVVPAP